MTQEGTLIVMKLDRLQCCGASGAVQFSGHILLDKMHEEQGTLELQRTKKLLEQRRIAGKVRIPTQKNKEMFFFSS